MLFILIYYVILKFSKFERSMYKMNDEYGLPIQKQCTVAFIDVLGIKNKIEFDSKWALNWMWIFYKNIMSEIKKIVKLKCEFFRIIF